jgi:predicted Zn-dependent protease
MNIRAGLAFGVAFVAGLTSPIALRAYSLIGGAWPSGTIPVQIQLDATAPATPALPLTDGTTTWNAVAQSAMDEWNSVMVRSKLVGTVSTSKTTSESDNINSVFFANTVFGDAFDTFTLAVTLTDNYDTENFPTVRIHEADLVVNANRTWNSYRGANHSNPVDLRRVVLHELGHVIGLNHPDAAYPVQNVTAIMNSTISNLETLQTDDRNGALFLYGNALVAPTLTKQPVGQTATASNSVTISIGINNAATAPDPSALLGYVWYFKPTGTSTFERLFTITSATLNFGAVQPSDAGQYYVQVMTPDVTLTSATVTLTVNPVTATPDTTLLNISTRALAGSGQTMIAGFVINGSRPKTILVRAIGPTLGSFGVGGTLADPKLTLLSLKDPANPATVATSLQTWDQDPTTASTLRSTMSRVGAFGLPAGSHDAVILATVPPGNYSAQATTWSSNSGVAMIEVYDADSTPDTTNRIINISTRGYVGTGDNVMISGFVVRGPGPHTYLIRVAGPSLANFNVTNTLFDPYLKLYSGSTLLREADDWDSPAFLQPTLSAAFTQVGAFAFTDRKESAMLVTLQPGNYTAIASGNDNAGTTSAVGNAIIEIYEIQ